MKSVKPNIHWSKYTLNLSSKYYIPLLDNIFYDQFNSLINSLRDTVLNETYKVLYTSWK